MEVLRRLVIGLDGVFFSINYNGVKYKMHSTTEIKKELIAIIADYKSTMSKDLQQALENLHDIIESDKE